MLLNRVEYLLMNNPVRSAIQRGWEARRLLGMGGPMNGGTALEIGCGRGVGIQLILDTFGASHVDAFDLDPRMVKAAQRRHRRRVDRVTVWQGDVTSIHQADAHYDAVFDFGIIHHVPTWRDAISEVWRVLKPGGRFYAEEVFGRFINGFPWRRLLAHPREDRFDAAEFSAALAAAHFRVLKVAEWQGGSGGSSQTNNRRSNNGGASRVGPSNRTLQQASTRTGKDR